MSNQAPKPDTSRSSSSGSNQLKGSEYSPDEFDLLAQSSPAGAHRKPVPRWKAVIPIIVILVLGPVLGWTGVAILKHHTGNTGGASSSQTTASSTTTDSSATETSSPEAEDDASSDTSSTLDSAIAGVEITVNNLSKTQSLGSDKIKVLQQAGFTNVQAGNSSGRGISASRVVYRDASARQAANQVATTLGIDTVTDGSNFTAGSLTSPVTVYLVN